MKRSHKIIVAVILALATVCAVAMIPKLRTSIPGRIVRWCLGEPGATQWVNDAADKIVSSGWAGDIHEVSARLMSEATPTYLNGALPKVYQDPAGYAITPNRLPLRYRKLGGSYTEEPEAVLRIGENGYPEALIICWGHMRQSIMIFSTPPRIPPRGFFVRKVDDRLYVVADET